MKAKNTVLILIILLLIGCKNREVKTSSAETVRVRLKEVTKELISIPVHTDGILCSSEELKLSFKTGGIVGKIFVKEEVTG